MDLKSARKCKIGKMSLGGFKCRSALGECHLELGEC